MKIHTIKGYIQTTYIIEYPDKILILDSGCRPDYKKILEFVTIQLARGIKDIKLVALSHAHPDHMGGADLLQTKFQIPIAATRETMQWYRGIKGTITYLIDVLLTYYVSYRLKKSIFVNLFFNRTISCSEICFATGKCSKLLDIHQMISVFTIIKLEPFILPI